MIVRISRGRFGTDTAEEVERELVGTYESLKPALERLTGLIAFYGGIDRSAGFMTNTSLWRSLESADQMRTLPEMLAARAQFEALGVEFEEITNHMVLWEVDGAGH